MLLLSSSSMRAGVTTPADVGRCLCRSLPNLPTAFPPTPQGRLLHCGFRGLLTFTCVPARMVAELPKAALCHQSASIHVVTSMDRPGCYQPERQLLGEIRTRQKKAPYSRRTESNPLGRCERFQIMSSSSPGLTTEHPDRIDADRRAENFLHGLQHSEPSQRADHRLRSRRSVPELRQLPASERRQPDPHGEVGPKHRRRQQRDAKLHGGHSGR